MKIIVERLAEAAAGLENLNSALENRREITGAIGEIARTATDMRFREEKGPDGKSWEPSLRAKLTGGKTLSDTGRLKNSITYQADSDTVEIGSNVIYARVHQKGGKIMAKSSQSLAFRLADGRFVKTKEVTMPARPFLGVNEEDLEDIGDMIIKLIREKIA